MDEAGAHVPVTRSVWNEHMSFWFELYAAGEWIRLMRTYGLVVEDLIEVQVHRAPPTGLPRD